MKNDLKFREAQLNIRLSQLMDYFTLIEKKDISDEKVISAAEEILRDFPDEIRAKEALSEIKCIIAHILYMSDSKTEDFYKDVEAAYKDYIEMRNQSQNKNLHKLGQYVLLDYGDLIARQRKNNGCDTFLIEHLKTIDKDIAPYSSVLLIKEYISDFDNYKSEFDRELADLEYNLRYNIDSFGAEERMKAFTLLADTIYSDYVEDAEKREQAVRNKDDAVQYLAMNRDLLNCWDIDRMSFVTESVKMLKKEYGLPGGNLRCAGKKHMIPFIQTESGTDEDDENESVLLCLHGFGGDKESSVIKNLMSYLNNKGMDVVAFDWPAHGKSTVADSELSVENCLQDLDDMVQMMHREYDEVNCFATSFGGYLAMLYHNAHPDVFQRLILRSPALRMDMVFRDLIGEEAFERMQNGEILELGFERKMRLGKDFYDDLEAHDVYHVKPCNTNRIMILQGDVDDVVPPEDIRNYAELHHIDMKWFEGTDHRYKKPGELERILVETGDWL